MNAKEKQLTKHRLGLCLQKILEENNNRDKLNLVSSLHQLSASSGVEYSIIQKISSGKKDPQWTTVISLIDGLNLSFSLFLEYYSKITESEILQEVEKRKKKKINKAKVRKGR